MAAPQGFLTFDASVCYYIAMYSFYCMPSSEPKAEIIYSCVALTRDFLVEVGKQTLPVECVYSIFQISSK